MPPSRWKTDGGGALTSPAPNHLPSSASSPDVPISSPPLGLEGFCEPAGNVSKESSIPSPQSPDASSPNASSPDASSPGASLVHLAASWSAQIASGGEKAAGMLLDAIERDISAEARRKARQRKTVQADAIARLSADLDRAKERTAGVRAATRRAERARSRAMGGP